MWLSAALHGLLAGSAEAQLELVELEEAAVVFVDAVASEDGLATSVFFGTMDVTRSGGTLQDAADAAGIGVASEVARHWQRHVDIERCHMRPAWPGLCVTDKSGAPLATRDIAIEGAAVAAQVADHKAPLMVHEVTDASGEILAAAIVGPRTLVRATVADGTQSLLWACDLAVSLYEEMAQGDQSSHRPYLRAMPRSFENGLRGWSDAELEDLGNRELARAAVGWQSLRSKCVQLIVQALQEKSAQQQGVDGASVCDVRVQLCLDLVVSRAIKLHSPDGSPYHALIPLFDFANHGEPNFQHELKDGFLEVRATRAVPQGEELLFDYGLTSEQCLITHCFLPEAGVTDLRTADGARLRAGALGQVNSRKASALPAPTLRAFARVCEDGLASLDVADKACAARAVDGTGDDGDHAALAKRYRSQRLVQTKNLMKPRRA